MLITIALVLIAIAVALILYGRRLWRLSSMDSVGDRAMQALRSGRKGALAGVGLANEMIADRERAKNVGRTGAVLLIVGISFLIYTLLF